MGAEVCMPGGAQRHPACKQIGPVDGRIKDSSKHDTESDPSQKSMERQVKARWCPSEPRSRQDCRPGHHCEDALHRRVLESFSFHSPDNGPDRVADAQHSEQEQLKYT